MPFLPIDSETTDGRFGIQTISNPANPEMEYGTIDARKNLAADLVVFGSYTA
jgi:hypothetical protein